MNDLINIEQRDGQFVVSSREVAENFGKRHSDVITRIKGKERPDGRREAGLVEQMFGCTGNPVHYFISSSYIDDTV